MRAGDTHTQGKGCLLRTDSSPRRQPTMVPGGRLCPTQQPCLGVIPCHRVVMKDGSLTKGFAFGGENAQRDLLLSEGVEFLTDGKVDMAKCQWRT